MIRDLTKKIKSSFLSCEKDAETILKKLFVTEGKYSDILKKLLVIQTKDCLNENQKYKEIIDSISVSDLIEQGYVSLVPKVKSLEHDSVKAYIIISFDNFTEDATNPQYRDCLVSFDILCHTDYWDIGDYRLRPYKIAGYIDGLLDGERLSGIGTFNFFSGNRIVLNESLAGFTLTYLATHGNDDNLPRKEEE